MSAMAKNNKDQYRIENEQYLKDKQVQEGVKTLSQGILYEILETGNGVQPTSKSVVTVYYKGQLISGRVFDDNTKQAYPDAFRLGELIPGWQIAIPQMHEGDKWRIYIPAELGYGSRGVSGIPCNSTLVFEIHLVKVAC